MPQALALDGEGSVSSSQKQALPWRALGSGDLDRINDLHRRAIDAVGRPDLIRPETREFFAAILNGGGSIIGVEDSDGLLAYGVLQWNLPPAEDLRGLLELPTDAPFAKLAGASVRPEEWGSGLHEASIAHRIADAAQRKLADLYSTSAPGNARSWSNLLNQGFAVRAVIEQYGGHLRYIMHRNAFRPALASQAELTDVTWCRAGATEMERSLIAAGRIGTVWRQGSDGSPEIGWVPWVRVQR